MSEARVHGLVIVFDNVASIHCRTINRRTGIVSSGREWRGTRPQHSRLLFSVVGESAEALGHSGYSCVGEARDFCRMWERAEESEQAVSPVSFESFTKASARL